MKRLQFSLRTLLILCCFLALLLWAAIEIIKRPNSSGHLRSRKQRMFKISQELEEYCNLHGTYPRIINGGVGALFKGRYAELNILDSDSNIITPAGGKYIYNEILDPTGTQVGCVLMDLDTGASMARKMFNVITNGDQLVHEEQFCKAYSDHDPIIIIFMIQKIKIK